MIQIIPVILCGGSGTRLWPLSREGFPKQFLVLTGSNSLFQQAVDRLNCLIADDINVGDTLVVTNEDHRFLALDQLREFKSVKSRLLLEPIGRNTAPALTLAALQAIDNGDDPILVVSPADQAVKNTESFTIAIQKAIRIAALGNIVVLGITPDRPETGYGYIKQGEASREVGGYSVIEFTEKPSSHIAQTYLLSGDYTWNSGIFVLRASTWLNAIKHFRPDISKATERAWFERSIDDPFVRPNKALFADIPSESIDYAVMEKCPGSCFSLSMVPLNAGWSDLGVWDAVWQAGDADECGNVVYGDALVSDTTNTLIHASSHLVGAVGVDNLVIIETADALLVADRNQSQNVKNLITELKQRQRIELNLHRKVHRPWGWYDSIDESDCFKVKRICVKPGASLSLQKHHHRSEHWIVVKGIAEVTCGEKVITLVENQSTYIPLGEVHRLANLGTTPLEIIEVQSGRYLGEDDIVRFDDVYGRN